MDKNLLPLNLSNTTINNIVTDHVKRTLTVYVETTESSTSCHKCGKDTCQRHGSDRERTIQHLPSVGYELYIVYKPNRYICTDCDSNPTTTATPDWHLKNSKFSLDYEQHVLCSMINSTVADTQQRSIN